MKKIKILIFVMSIFLLNFFNIKVNAYSNDLDRIELYEITVDPRDDGTLDIDFNIRWRVLDSTSEGPLSWVKIGIPNYHVDEITAKTNNIKKIEYYMDNGSFIRIDFDRNYYRDDVITFSFSIHQSYMYHLSKENNVDMCIYDYNPGWFDEIIVEKAVLKWNKNNVDRINLTSVIGEYYYIESRLSYSETIQVRVNYKASSFSYLDPNKQYSSKYMTPEAIRKVVISVSIIVLIAFSITIFSSYYNRNYQDPYSYNRGFCGNHYMFFYRPYRRYYRSGVNRQGKQIINPVSSSNNNTNSRGGSCACACACACAGGGRAGCSRKDFYNKNLKTKDLIK